jgi:hypothetical protein
MPAGKDTPNNLTKIRKAKRVARTEMEREDLIDLLPNRYNAPLIKKKRVSRKPNHSKRK